MLAHHLFDLLHAFSGKRKNWMQSLRILNDDLHSIISIADWRLNARKIILQELLLRPSRKAPYNLDAARKRLSKWLWGEFGHRKSFPLTFCFMKKQWRKALKASPPHVRRLQKAIKRLTELIKQTNCGLWKQALGGKQAAVWCPNWRIRSNT